ncbi:MAG: LysM peptidoglycan-binding domain-containing protein [Planctomycetota bacterium]
MVRRGVNVWGPWAVVLVVVAAATGWRRAHADMPADWPLAPDTKIARMKVELEWGPVAKLVSRPHVVARGDTLRALATRYYGDAKAWPLIAQANPKHVTPPDGIQAGDTLWIPPRESGYEAFWLMGLAHRPGVHKVLRRATPGEKPQDLPSYLGLLLFLPATDAASVIAALDTDAGYTFEEPPPRGHLVGLGHSAVVPIEDPVHSLLVRYSLKGIAPGGVEVEKTVTRLDADGRELPPLPEAEPAGGPPPAARPSSAFPAPQLMSIVGDIPVDEPLVEKVATRWPVWVGLLVAIVGLGIVLTVVRKRMQGGRAPDEE